MVVYADILIVLNFIVDYFLLLATDKFLHNNTKLIRLLLGALFGGITALYIFLPQVSILIEFITKLVICFVTTIIAFQFKSFKHCIKSAGIYFIITSTYAGIMMALWHIFKPDGMVINNSVVYFNISPIILVLSTVIFYIFFTVCYKIFSRQAVSAQECEIRVFAEEKNVDLHALVDTGNSVEDVFGKSEILIVDSNVITSLFGKDSFLNTKHNSRFRIIPFKTVSGEDYLKGFRCDKAEISFEGKIIELKKPIIAASKLPFDDNFNAIVNPKILD